MEERKALLARECVNETYGAWVSGRPKNEQLSYYKQENRRLTTDYNELFDAQKEREDQDKRNAAAQTWTNGDWDRLLPDLPTAQQQVNSLYEILQKVKFDLVGRDEILNQLASIVHTFAETPLAFTDSFLNFALLGPPGTGKTTLARVIGDIFRTLGVILTSKFDQVSREDLVGGFLGETAIKTRGVLNEHIEGVLFIDEAYGVAQGGKGSNTMFDQYGVEALNTLVGFLDKQIGQIVVVVAGYARDTDLYFFGANEGLARRFPFRYYLTSFTADQLTTMLLTRLFATTPATERHQLGDDATWAYVHNSLDELNKKGYLPNQGGDIQNLASVAQIYFNTNIKGNTTNAIGARVRALRANDVPATMSICDWQKVLQQHLFVVHKAAILPGTAAINAACHVDRAPDCGGDILCLPPESKADEAGEQKRREENIALRAQIKAEEALESQEVARIVARLLRTPSIRAEEKEVAVAVAAAADVPTPLAAARPSSRRRAESRSASPTRAARSNRRGGGGSVTTTGKSSNRSGGRRPPSRLAYPFRQNSPPFVARLLPQSF